MSSKLSDADVESLVQAARDIRARAYAPYSGYHVGAALRAEDGRVFCGTNVENSAYPICLCAERNALGTAVVEGATRFVAIAIVTELGKDGRPGSPCGSCRQALSEFAPGLEVVMAGPEGGSRIRRSMAELLPHAFSATSL